MKKLILILILIAAIICAVFYFQSNKISGGNMNSTALIGEWYSHGDCPTIIFTFSKDMKLNVRGCDGEYGDTINQTTTYQIADNKIVALLDKDTYEFTFEQSQGEQKLKVTSKNGSYLLSKKDRE